MKKKAEYISPLNLYIVWHPAFQKGVEVAEYLYASFTRDIESPLSRSIGIPVYFRSNPERNSCIPRAIDLNQSDYNCIVLLIDDEMFNDDSWNIFVKKLIPKRNASTRIFPVAFSSNAFYFEESTLGREQFR